MYKKLTIVSDTAIYKKQGVYYAFQPVVDEINCIEASFEKITWIGFNRVDKINNSTMKMVTNNKINIVLLNPVGGNTIKSFLKIMLNYPVMFFIIFKNIFSAQVVHTRAPSHPAFIATLISFIFRKKIWWHKFAGSWEPSTLPKFYKFQRNLLLKAKFSKVAINGFWDDQASHCFSFENPCLTDNDIKIGKEIVENKSFNKPFVFTFIGRLDDKKGVNTIIDSLKLIDKNNIAEVHFIGDSKLKDKYIKESNYLENMAFFHGQLDKVKVHDILKKSHFLLLPSKSEGFPKVIAEAACYGVIPIVSNVGSISHYIDEENGFLWEINSKNQYYSKINEAVTQPNIVLAKKSKIIYDLSKQFTFNEYLLKLKQFF